MTQSIIPKIYVGTYHKYNTGSLKGEWIELDLFDEIEEFYQHCKELHSDEDDPEFMVQDWEGIPDAFISESSLKKEYFTYQELMLDLSESQAKALKIYMENRHCNEMDLAEDPEEMMSSFEDAFYGDYSGYDHPRNEFAWQLAENNGWVKAMDNAGMNRSYFDVDYYQRELFMHSFWEKEGFIFDRNA